jgi:hypothetical protein
VGGRARPSPAGRPAHRGGRGLRWLAGQRLLRTLAAMVAVARAAVGGVLARGFGLRAPFLVTGAAQLVLTLLAVPIVRQYAGQPVRLA